MFINPSQNKAQACSDLVGLEAAMMKSEASAEDILISTMNRLGYGVHANSTINAKYIRSIEASRGKRAAVNIIAAEIRKSFGNLKNNNHFPYRVLADKLSNFPGYGPYKVGLNALKTERERFIADFPQEVNPLNKWRQNARKTQQIRKLADAINEKEFNAPSVITSFWYNHFNVQSQKARDTANHYEMALRQKACGNFKDLLITSAKHPAMNLYLDNVVNQRNKINENYAREVIELHTLGTGPSFINQNGNKVNVYTNEEIIEAAKVLSGWNFNNQTYNFEFRTAANERGNKVFRTLFNNVTISESEGVKGGEKFLTLLAQHTRTKRHICRKIGTRLYGRHPGKTEVDKCVTVYGENGNLAKMYESFILSEEFWNKDKFFVGTKNPFENMVSAMRGLGVNLSEGNPDAKLIINLTVQQSENFGESMFNFAEPTGYKQLNRATTPTNLISNRLDILNRLTDFSKVNYDAKSNFPLEKTITDYVTKNGSQATYNYIINDVAAVFPSYIKANRQLANEIVPELTRPETQAGKATPLKAVLVRLLSSGGFLRK
jgi:uncharacterized protein (DUF1800 family)